eukprot:3648490-Pleurochrysis_carterae.AAC.1
MRKSLSAWALPVSAIQQSSTQRIIKSTRRPSDPEFARVASSLFDAKFCQRRLRRTVAFVTSTQSALLDRRRSARPEVA